jgi:U3 small nucleolar RNA-associated protein 14
LPTKSIQLNVATDGPKLQLADLLAPLQDEVPSSSLLSLTNAIKPLKGAKGAPLPAPLPVRIQDRINREAAYEATKTEVEKWAPTMKRIREVFDPRFDILP